MSLVQINGSTQIQLESISDDRLAERYVKADGTRVFEADQSLNGYRLTDLGEPVDAADAATRGFVYDALLDTTGPVTDLGKALISSATEVDACTAIEAEYAPNKGQPNGYAALDETGRVPLAQLPPPAELEITKADVGLGNVDNTSDATKWAATANLTNKTLDVSNSITVRATNFTLRDNTNATKQGRFSLETNTPNVTAVYVLPPSSTTLAGTDSIQNLTNKVMSGDLNTFTDIPQSAIVLLDAALAARELIVNRGQASGYVPLNNVGKIDAGYLPSYVDDVVEVDTRTELPTVGESGKIYVAVDTQAMYRWTGSVYVLIGGDPDLKPGNYSQTVGDGESTTFVLEHDMHTVDVMVAVWEVATGIEVNCDIRRTTVNTVTLTFAEAPATNAYRAVVLNGGVLADKTASVPADWSTSTMISAGTLAASSNFTYIVLLDAGAAPTLPTAVGNSSRYVFKNIHTTNKTVLTTGGQTIESLATLVLAPGASAEVVSDGTNWRII